MPLNHDERHKIFLLFCVKSCKLLGLLYFTFLTMRLKL